MASVTTSEFVRTTSRLDAPPFSLLEQKGLIARLAEEFARAWGELTRDPRGFIRAIFADDNKDAKRRRRIRIVLVYALVAHAAAIALIAFLGWHHLIQPEAAASNLKVDTILPPKSPDKPDDTQSPLPRGKEVSGGGSGGNHNPLPVTKGEPPKMSPAPQIVKPLAMPVPTPVLPMNPTIKGPESQPPPVGVAIGIPTGAQSDLPSPGSGAGEGIGKNNGSGVGEGTGPGGPGKGGEGGTGNKGRPGVPNGVEGTNGPIPFNRLKEIPGSSGIVWIRRPRPVTTAEAQANKVKGEVWMMVTFRADGTIGEIEVIREVPFMTDSAIEAVRQSKFRPATVNGQPITLTRVPIRVNVTASEN
jgi:outer membrane biosynthesis protein TonB